jgi:hypothetical protein
MAPARLETWTEKYTTWTKANLSTKETSREHQSVKLNKGMKHGKFGNPTEKHPTLVVHDI